MKSFFFEDSYMDIVIECPECKKATARNDATCEEVEEGEHSGLVYYCPECKSFLRYDYILIVEDS